MITFAGAPSGNYVVGERLIHFCKKIFGNNWGIQQFQVMGDPVVTMADADSVLGKNNMIAICMNKKYDCCDKDPALAHVEYRSKPQP